MTTYKAIILVLSSDDDCLSNTKWSVPRIYPEWKPMYPFFKSIWEQYHLKNSQIKVFYVYGNTTVSRREYDLIFNHVLENNYPGMITKTLLGMDYIEKNYNYDFLIRTNLSTFWNLNLLEKRLNNLPKRNCLTGTVIYRNQVEKMVRHNLKNLMPESYIAGYDLILSRDIVCGILPYAEDIIKNRVVLDMEDLSLCEGIKKFCNIEHLPYDILDQAVDMDLSNKFDNLMFTNKINEADRNNQYHFRVKNRLNRNVDKTILSKLLETYYT